MKHFSLFTNSLFGSGQVYYTSKQRAIAAFDRAFCFSGDVTLIQGNYRTINGVVYSYGPEFVLAQNEFSQDGVVIRSS